MRANQVSVNSQEYFAPNRAPTQWFATLLRTVNALIARTGGVSGAAFGPLPPYAVADVPSAAAHARCLIWVSNEVGGAQPAYSDGTSWRRVSDGDVISA